MIRIPVTQLESIVIRTVLAAAVLFLLATFPSTWLLMLFLGNAGMNLSYWGTLPLGVLVSVLLAGAATPAITVDER
jgi:hypothetical protein